MNSFGKTMKNLKPGMITIVGVPSDENSSFMHGPAKAPAKIREVLYSGSSNMWAENRVDLGTEPRFYDVGDLDLTGESAVIDQIEEGIRSLLEHDVHVLSLGGDHAVTYPIVKAHHEKVGKLNIVHLDAHPDLYEEFEGNRFSHACPFARIMEADLATRLVQIGIRTMNSHQRFQADRYGVEVVEARSWMAEEKSGGSLTFDGPVYLSLDMDVLDPAFAPGVSHHEPGGLSSRDVIQIIQEIRGPIVGADIVELNPRRDPVGITAMAAAKFLKEIAARMIK